VQCLPLFSYRALFRLKNWHNITETVRQKIEWVTERMVELLSELRTEEIVEWLRG
jgi:hypothetical protein